ncbi:MAG: monodechloroaminopyrrolnitrin synthase PrnB family protein [Pseudomonadota bacterium]
MPTNRRGEPQNAQAFDDWIRNRFVTLNSQLERLYREQAQRENVANVGETLKQTLVTEGRALILPLLEEGNTDQGFESGFDLLGNVGLYMAACRRHEVTLPDREHKSPLVEASALAMHLGASLGVTPRFATSHLSTHNFAINGVYKRFTNLKAEQVFLDYNTRGIFAYKRAADALSRILPIGISHPAAADLLSDAKHALASVSAANQALFNELNIDDFFFAVRPYYKPFKVGFHTYRGANAGDFAGINEVDMLLGVCQANDPAYSQQLVDKFLYMMPEDQRRLRDCMRKPSLMDDFIASIDSAGDAPWFKRHAALFIDVCAAHGQTAVEHHDQLVQRFIAHPSAQLPAQSLTHITASGPPLPALLAGLEKLRDQRCAADRDDIVTRYADMQRLKAALH